jgi:pimeloyl-ACP methyl ester carboxylesterase
VSFGVRLLWHRIPGSSFEGSIRIGRDMDGSLKYFIPGTRLEGMAADTRGHLSFPYQEDAGPSGKFSGRTVDVPSMYIAGKSDWGVYQTPGAVDRMQTSSCTRMVGFHLLDRAGHWVQQDQVTARLIAFLREYASASARL